MANQNLLPPKLVSLVNNMKKCKSKFSQNLSYVVLSLALIHVVSADDTKPQNAVQQVLIEPTPANAPSAAQQIQIDRKYGMFCHYGINTYAGKDMKNSPLIQAISAI